MSNPPRQPIPPKPFSAPPRGLWRATPPAIFPPLLGLFGIGLAWRQATVVLGAPAFIGDMFLGAVSLLYLFAVFAYLAKVVRRLATLPEDLRILPGRAGLPAASAAGMLFAAVLVPYATMAAQSVLVLALCAHALIALLIIRALLIGPVEQRRVTPAWHLSFVGFIIAPLAAVPLGWVELSQVIFVTTLPVAVAVWIISAFQFSRADVPVPLRPLLAIHLAPVCLFGIVSALLGYGALSIAFGGLGIIVMAVMLMAVRYLTAGDFSALWGAFTFPMAAFANLMFAAAFYKVTPFAVLGGIELALATLAVCVIAFRVMKLWANGKLAKSTNASTV
ncbi:tellurium resistance protein [Celeribacter arenosi]|uniref:Tellurium resistance protein n=1 Tax=Celeribacter arenosi TaxID=792649 RepID=A0ABP7KJ39_9RHOB